MKLEAKLRSLPARLANESCTGTERDQRIDVLVEEIRDAVREYQVSGALARPPLPVGWSTEASVGHVS